MESISFNYRFKNRIERIGRNGILSVNELNAIIKEELPKNKLYNYFKNIESKPILTRHPSIDENIRVMRSGSYRNPSSSKLPYLDRTNTKPGLCRNCSKSSNDVFEVKEKNTLKKKLIAKSTAILPSITDRVQNLRKVLKRHKAGSSSKG